MHEVEKVIATEAAVESTTVNDIQNDADKTRDEGSTSLPCGPKRNKDTDFELMVRDTKGKITQPPATKRLAPTPTDTLHEPKRHKTNTSDSDESGKQLNESEEAGEESSPRKHN